MEQLLVKPIENQLSQIRELKQQKEDLYAQLEIKEKSRKDFYWNSQKHCKHIFYRIQRLVVSPVTVGYRCYICGKESREVKSFNGSITLSPYSKDTRPPVPPECQDLINRRDKEISKIDKEIKSIKRRINSIQSSIDSMEAELHSIADLLNHFFEIPTVIISEPHKWNRDDFNYDPFD